MTSLLQNDFWDRNMDPRVRGFPLVSEGPWKILAIATAYILIAKLWGPTLSKKIDLRPWLVVHNGFAFGCHGAGLAVALTLSNMGLDGLDCRPLTAPKWTVIPTFEYIKSESTIHLACVLLFIRIFLLTEGIAIRILTDKPLSTSRIMNEVSLLFMCYMGFKYMPGGPVMFFGLTYLMFYTFSYGYYTLRCGYPSDTGIVQSSKKFLIALRLVWSITTFCHHLYLLTSESCQSPVIFPLALLEGAYSLGVFFNAILSLRNFQKLHVA